MVILFVQRLHRAKHKLRGFNLTELALVMAAVVMLVTGIWLAYDRVSSNLLYEKAQKQMATIVANMRSLMANSTKFNCVPTAGATCDITDAMVRSGIFPSDTRQSDDLATTAREDLQPLTPWNTRWYILSQPDSGGTSSQEFILLTQDIPDALNPLRICSEMLARHLGRNRDQGLVGIWRQIAGGTLNRDVTENCAGGTVCDPESAAAFCRSGSDATGFGLRFLLKP
jgi:hypothetical protein